MRFATLRIDDTLTAARIEGDRAVLVDASHAVDAYLRREHLTETGEVDGRTAHYARVSPSPAHILCIGLNYRSHIQQLERPTPAYPTFFASSPPHSPALATTSHCRGSATTSTVRRNWPSSSDGA